MSLPYEFTSLRLYPPYNPLISLDKLEAKKEKKLKAIEDKFVYFDVECPTLVEDRGYRSISELGTIVDVLKFHVPQLAISYFLL